MAKKSNSSSKQKKKGPKGKKARAKALLERHWGEVPKTSSSTTLSSKDVVRPRGQSYSRLTKSSQRSISHPKTSAATLHDSPTEIPALAQDHSDSESSRTDDDDDDEEQSMPVDASNDRRTWLTHLRKQKRRTSHLDASDDLSVDGFDGDDTDAMSDSAHDDDEAVDTTDNASLFPTLTWSDPFTLRFNRPPLHEHAPEALAEHVCQVQQQLVSVPLSHTTKKDSTSPWDFRVSQLWWDHFNSLVGSKGSHPSLSAIEKAAENSLAHCNLTPAFWNACAQQLFRYNRESLQQACQSDSFHVSLFKGMTNTSNDSHIISKHSKSSNWHGLWYTLLASYTDFLYTSETRSDRQALYSLVSLHVLNHILTLRGRIYKHNPLWKPVAEPSPPPKKKGKKAKLVEETPMDPPVSLPRDQGLTRPTVLILLPTRGVCYQWMMQTLVPLLTPDPARTMEHWDRFEAEFGPPPNTPAVDTNDPKQVAREQRRQKILQQKGAEWRELFGEHVNDDDDFQLGVSFNGGSKAHGSVRLFSDFYKSDMIVASPLGLKVTLTSHANRENGDNDDDEEEENGAADFLSSIEICVLLRADVMLMQNWDHVNDVLNALNQRPKSSRHLASTNFARVREYALAGQSDLWRQMIVCSSITDPLILNTFKRLSRNRDGQARLRRKTRDDQAALTRVIWSGSQQPSQVFQRIPCQSFASQGDDRLKCFVQHWLPKILEQKHTMIFVPSYFEFVSLRNMLLQKEIDFVSITEYARTSEVTRGRARFLQGRKSLLLYTGRAHYFLRHRIKGVQHVIWYGLPELPTCYTEIVNALGDGLSSFLDDANHASTTSITSSSVALFTKYESHALERIVGSGQCQRLLKADKNTFSFSA
jgi:U3 small nucleolar RNA-associated protein 25